MKLFILKYILLFILFSYEFASISQDRNNSLQNAYKNNSFNESTRFFKSWEKSLKNKKTKYKTICSESRKLINAFYSKETFDSLGFQLQISSTDSGKYFIYNNVIELMKTSPSEKLIDNFFYKDYKITDLNNAQIDSFHLTILFPENKFYPKYRSFINSKLKNDSSNQSIEIEKNKKNDFLKYNITYCWLPTISRITFDHIYKNAVVYFTFPYHSYNVSFIKTNRRWYFQHILCKTIE